MLYCFIRPVANDDDQKRVVDVATAFKSGSDYIVVGRPIKNADNPYETANPKTPRHHNLLQKHA
jgi:orotidine-5'-phosphate decarboxylase